MNIKSSWIKIVTTIILSLYILIFADKNITNPHDTKLYNSMDSFVEKKSTESPILLVKNTENTQSSSSDAINYLLILGEAGADKILASGLLEIEHNGKNLKAEYQQELTDLFDNEFLVITDNVSKLFEAIKQGSVRSNDAASLVDKVLMLIIKSKNKLLDSALDRDNIDYKKLTNLCSAYTENYVASTVGGIGIPIPVFSWGKIYPKPLSEKEIAAFKFIETKTLTDYLAVDMALYKAIKKIEDAAYIKTTDPNLHPIILYEYALSLKREIENTGNKAAMQAWLKARNDFVIQLKQFLVSNVETEAVKQVSFKQTGNANVTSKNIKAETEIVKKAFYDLRLAAGDFLSMRKMLEDSIHNAKLIINFTAEKDIRPTIIELNAALNNLYIIVPLQIYILSSLVLTIIISSLLCGLLSFKRNLIASIVLCIVIAIIQIVFFLNGIWIFLPTYFFIIAANISVSILDYLFSRKHKNAN